MSARQYPRQPAISSHIYRMHSSFPVVLCLVSVLFTGHVRLCMTLNESFTAVTRVQFMYFYLKVCVTVAVFDVFLWSAVVTARSLNHTSDIQSIECACVHMCGCVGFVLMCVDLFFLLCVCVHFCAFFFLTSNATWGSLKLMGPPVASLLVFLHPSPLGRVLATRP